MRSHKKYSMDFCLNWLMKTMSKTTYLKLHELSSHSRNGNIWGIAIQKYSMRICSFNMVSSSHLMHDLAACCCIAALVYVNLYVSENIYAMVFHREKMYYLLDKIDSCLLLNNLDCEWQYLCNAISSRSNVKVSAYEKGK